jgi:hypothetical protein
MQLAQSNDEKGMQVASGVHDMSIRDPAKEKKND